jgi:hypothetical protein
MRSGTDPSKCLHELKQCVVLPLSLPFMSPLRVPVCPEHTVPEETNAVVSLRFPSGGQSNGTVEQQPGVACVHWSLLIIILSWMYLLRLGSPLLRTRLDAPDQRLQEAVQTGMYAA